MFLLHLSILRYFLLSLRPSEHRSLKSCRLQLEELQIKRKLRKRKDVVVLTGLPIDGQPVIGSTSSRGWEGLMHQLPDASPAKRKLVGGSLKMSWLLQHFASIDDHMGSEKQLDCFTRAYMLRLIGGVRFSDHSSSRVPLRYLSLIADFDTCAEYSWGSVVLTYLYRELCGCTDYDKKKMCRFSSLLQLWARECFPKLSPERFSYDDHTVPLGAR
ncbi:hypothetical protein VNO77_31124 [Canavalia gladiata]|uniref:Aminotransferase-like plant mobile domain-containing protein n=1 Tax=Canavalia gladiata TaxID=3824 RepID=A0AAN9KNZ7_CANGL